MTNQEKELILHQLRQNVKDFENWVKQPFSEEKPCQVKHMLCIQNNAFNIAEFAFRLKIITFEEWYGYVDRLYIVEDEPKNCTDQRCEARIENGKCKYDFRPCEFTINK